MLIYNDERITNNIKENYVALGSFDGLHFGHLCLVDKICQLAKDNQGKAMVFTFKDHPKKLINPDAKLDMLMTNTEKVNILEKKNVDILVLKSFDNELMKMEAEEFIRFLCESYNIKGIVVGFNFRFGYKNLGDIDLLKEFTSKYNYELFVIPPYKYEGQIVSSTEIRGELLKGEVSKAYKMLSRPYSIEGTVIDGKKIGRTIGFPTANMKIPLDKLIPAKGVYYTNVEYNGEIFKAITNIGNNPTVNGQELTVESYILDFNSDIYGENIKIFFVDKIRNEVKFHGLESLISQLNKDKDFAKSRNILKL